MRFVDLPTDLLLAFFLDLDVEDVLSLKQSCRVLYTIGSLDYLWHKLVRRCNLPLNISLGADSSTLSGQELQVIVVKALKLDHNWRNPDAHIQRAIPIMRWDKSYVNNMHLLPGGKWLVATQLTGGFSAPHTNLSLWCLDDMTSPCIIKTVRIYGSATSCRAYYQPARHKFTIAVALGRDVSEWIEVYHISLDNPAAATHSESLVIPSVASDEPLRYLCNIDNLRICGDLLGATYHEIPDQDYIHPHQPVVETVHVYLRNLVTGATATFKACDGDWHQDRIAFELFRNQYALGYAARHDLSEQIISFYDIPPSIIPENLEPAPNSDSNPSFEGILSSRCRPPHRGSFSYRASSGSLEHGIPILNTMLFSGSSREVIIDRFSPPDHETRFIGLPTIASQAFPHHGVMGDHKQLGATGRRAVWVDFGAAAILRKWTSSRRRRGEELSAGTSILMPPSSGLPFNSKDICRIAFDEATCRLCIGLLTGELYICDFL
ncbi:hypothetical protein BJ138DRAFT_1091229 [Hygrophoropsis aurantiaca]|uniref:Uncharacterized protein n=1 Tax=Hygrophoropsis aurantiaca TaxID=72124 RepID=A0ACB8A6U3_9AGAM|nr:hypothetical protein BJ138DRAFT_1091229 [Hygrophoropsis aurantiaca]